MDTKGYKVIADIASLNGECDYITSPFSLYYLTQCDEDRVFKAIYKEKEHTALFDSVHKKIILLNI
ncbi:MAG: hypothetical protein KBT30_02235 [Clostridiales bacterium]|nr:hypothetical protein [Candidatus Apopatousia equi]